MKGAFRSQAHYEHYVATEEMGLGEEQARAESRPILLIARRRAP